MSNHGTTQRTKCVQWDPHSADIAIVSYGKLERKRTQSTELQTKGDFPSFSLRVVPCRPSLNQHKMYSFEWSWGWGKRENMPSKIILQLPFGLFNFTTNLSAVSCPPCSPEMLTHTISPVPVGTSFCQIYPHCSYSVPRLGNLLVLGPVLCLEDCGGGTI